MSLSVRGRIAHAGHPLTDLDNVLRFDRRPAYADAVLAAWCERRDTDPRETLELARAADLWALLDLVARRGENPFADRAHAHLLAMARTGDLHALPWCETGVLTDLPMIGRRFGMSAALQPPAERGTQVSDLVLQRQHAADASEVEAVVE